jgi:hypothetical protein
MANIQTASEATTPELDEPIARFEQARARLATSATCGMTPDEAAERLIAVLESAAFAGLDAWTELMLHGQLMELEAVLPSSAWLLAGYEQQLFAPMETGLRERALVLIEALGHRDASVTRDAERLLHAAGEPQAAYRVERGRRSPRLPKPAPAIFAPLTGLAVAVAGGHPKLRKMIRRDLARAGISDVREIPSAFEASRSGRDVAAKLGGVDLAVVILRQIAHSTSDQVTVAAAKTGVPVAFTHSASLGGVRREVEAFAANRGAP